MDTSEEDAIYKARRSREGSKGGKKTLSLYGKSHFSVAGKKGAKARYGKKKNGKK